MTSKQRKVKEPFPTTQLTSTAICSKLLRWFDAHQRPLPWRHCRDPYRIWVSEVMLQQTTVAAVLSYFNRFLAAFPTVQALADAPAQEVLRHWEGLGYYRRARHLHAAAKIIVAEHGGKFPRDAAQAKALPGVGRYILGAVLSQAYEVRLPIVEANSLRVLARFFGYRGDPRRGVGQRWTWQTAEALLPTKRVGDFNQALMELGALVCTLREPKCKTCPLRRECVASRENLQNAIPPAKAPTAIIPLREAAIVIRRGDTFLLGQRPDGAARGANHWEFPHGEVKEGEALEAAAVRIAKELTNLRIRLGDQIVTLKHGVTKYAITITAFAAAAKSGQPRSKFYSRLRWCSSKAMRALPTSTPQRAIMREATKSTQQKRLL
jgi:A/G-specific adenine glycosylase